MPSDIKCEPRVIHTHLSSFHPPSIHYNIKTGFYNNFVGMFGFVKQRKAAKKNWEERQEYEDLVKVLAAEKKAARLAREAEEAEELQLEIAAVLKKEAEVAEAQREKLTAKVAEEREAAGVRQIR